MFKNLDPTTVKTGMDSIDLILGLLLLGGVVVEWEAGSLRIGVLKQQEFLLLDCV